MEKFPPKTKYRQCMFVLYPESQQDIIDYCQKYLPCAWALHDKDTYENDDPSGNYKKGDLKKPHVHFVCRFQNPRAFSGIAKELTIGENVINKCNSLFKAYVYLWHRDTPDKFQYDADIVGMNDEFTPPTENGIGQEEEEQIKLLLDMPCDEMQTTANMVRWAFENGCWSAFKSNYAIPLVRDEYYKIIIKGISNELSISYFRLQGSDADLMTGSGETEVTLPDGTTDYIPPEKINPDYDFSSPVSPPTTPSGFLDYIGSLMTSVSEFLSNLIRDIGSIFEEFKGFGSNFSSFLASTFSFIPKPLLSLIILSFSLSILLGVFGFFRGK